ncbi:hypothetical protein B0T17DRAFT_527344 [Bombardia bombarda]|uniref:Uncharacterized protein n=1 Tax=Bombardia bombarda TaxID=252184 RepID=A0AA39X9Y2_9PEZI|nr:hypothetical protein B0T17DRAFT_527344 [Bombardia bombarda]
MFAYFFDLPPELREQILQHLCLFPNGVFIGTHRIPTSPISGPGRRVRAAAPPVNMFLASPVLYHEAGRIYYGQNTFSLDCRPSRLTRLHDLLARAETGLLTSAGARVSRHRMRSVVVYICRLGSLLQDCIIPALADMVLSGALKRVDFRLEESVGMPMVMTASHLPTSASTTSNEPGFVSAPFQALLRLLVDPDMEDTHLRVAARSHPQFWGQYYMHCQSDGLGRQRKKQQQQQQQSLAFHDGDVEAADWVEVDVNKLLERYGGSAAEFRITRVGD